MDIVQLTRRPKDYFPNADPSRDEDDYDPQIMMKITHDPASLQAFDRFCALFGADVIDYGSVLMGDGTFHFDVELPPARAADALRHLGEEPSPFVTLVS